MQEKHCTWAPLASCAPLPLLLPEKQKSRRRNFRSLPVLEPRERATLKVDQRISRRLLSVPSCPALVLLEEVAELSGLAQKSFAVVLQPNSYLNNWIVHINIAWLVQKKQMHYAEFKEKVFSAPHCIDRSRTLRSCYTCNIVPERYLGKTTWHSH